MLETVAARYPHVAGYLYPPAGAQELSWSEALTPQEIVTSTAATGELFRIRSQSAAAHLRFVNFVKAWITPSLAGYVDARLVADLDLRQATLATADHVWYAHDPGPAQDWGSSLAGAGTCLRELIEATVSATGLRPAPLWAQASDLIAIALAEAGNEGYAPVEAVDAAREAFHNLRSRVDLPLPLPRMYADRQLIDLDSLDSMDSPAGGVGLGDESVLTVRRLTCCKIDRSEVTGPCDTCPHNVHGTI